MVGWASGESLATSAGSDVVAGDGEVVEGGLGVDGLPEHDDVDHQPERAELVFLACLVLLGELAECSVEHVSGEAVAAFDAVQDSLDVAPVDGVVAVVQDVQGLDDAAEFDERSHAPRCRSRSSLGLA